MRIEQMILVTISVYFIFCTSGVFNVENGCNLRINGKSISLAPLDWVWPISVKSGSQQVNYEISLCRSLDPQGSNCTNSSVCTTENGQSYSLASFNGGDYQATLRHDFSWLVLQGPKCAANPTFNHEVIFHFKCGSSIGSPELYFSKECQTYFSWSTSVVCDNQPRQKDVPCYVYDKDTGNKHDLYPLIKSKGGYQVAGTGSDSLVINVCSELAGDNSTGNAKCPPGSAACLERDGKFYSVGRPKKALSYTRLNKLLQIVYEEEGDVFPPGCDRPPKTKITFFCPSQVLMHGPQLVAKENCQFEILWEVMYACPEEAFSGDLKSCKFTNGYHNLEFDLSPLRIQSGHEPYHVTSKINDTSVDFYLNVCGGLGDDFCCSGKSGGRCWKSTSACLKDSKGIVGPPGTSHTIGTLKGARLLYVDGSISLIYTGNGGCNQTNAYWRTVINFICNKTAVDEGPKFAGQEYCLYYFDWNTVHACPKKYLNDSCSYMNGSMEINLEDLHRKAGSEGWLVIDGTAANNNKRQIFLNVCGRLETSGAASRCPNDSAICIINKLKRSGKSLGRYSSAPEYDARTGVVVINYYSGDPCGSDSYIQSQIKFFCHLGITSSNPVLVKESNCYYEFEWYTDAACPKSEEKGKDCKIMNNNLGLHLDLSPLTSETPYQVTGRNYTFFLNVCGQVKGTECNFKQHSLNTGGCATSLSNPEEHVSIGEASSELVYKNGMLFLEYTKANDPKSPSKNAKIIFFCEPSAGQGKPLFMDQTNDWFIFYWYTSHACLRKTSVDCMASDPQTGSQYDLSSLTKLDGKDAWSVSSENRKYYLNICHPLNSVPQCSGEASVCAVDVLDGKEEKAVPNLGQALSAPVVQSDGHLVLKYTLGEKCTSYGQNVNYSATIHFMCHKGNREQSIRLLGRFGICNYSFLWATEAACAIETEEVHDVCNITDPISGQIYNLKSLKLVNGFYNVSSGSRKFRLNICGSVGNGGCGSTNKNVSVCEVKANGKTNIVSLTNRFALRVSEDMLVRLLYKSEAEDNDSSVEIGFKCAEVPTDIAFVEERDDKYFFEMATPLACKHQPVYCSVTGPRGDHYDLASLGHTPFRIAFDIRPHMNSWLYQVSLCSPLDSTLGSSLGSVCDGTGACMTNFHAEDEKSLGYQQMFPEFVDNGNLIVYFSNGSECAAKNGVKNKNSAEVELHCSYKEKELQFLGESSCHYKFSLETPAACPVQTYNGSNCSVKNLFTNEVFDLSPLKRSDQDYKVKHQQYTYLINVCDSLLTPPKGCEGVGVCQTKTSDPQFAINAGMPTHELSYKDGLITLTYNSGKGSCHKKFSRSTVITFVCDYTTTGIEEGPIFINEEDDCTYGFFWRSSYACPPYEKVGCAVTNNKGETYELDTLALSSDNYYVKDPRNSTRTFAINVCRTLISQPKFRCLPSSAACLLDRNENHERSHYPAVSLGTKMSSPIFIDGTLTLAYISGDKCKDGGQESETIIQFKCFPKEKFTLPEFIKQEGCRFYFLWETSVACPTVRKEVASNGCTVTNSQTGQVFDFTSLASNKLTSVKIGTTQEFFLNICQNVPNDRCGQGVGSCQIEKGKTVRAGNANSMLHFDDGTFFLNYTGGDKCNGGMSERNTVIRIACSMEENVGPRFMFRLNDCTYNFVWYTPLACERQIPCTVNKDGATLDLAVLANTPNTTTLFYSFEKSATFFLNVCQPLVSYVYSYCPQSAAVCKVVFGTSSGLSLGRLWRSPYFNDQDKITVEYKEGSVCPNDTNKRMSSQIYFICDHTAGRGTPELMDVSEDECAYVFEWRTNVVCTEEMLSKVPSSDCVFEDKEKGFALDLSRLWRNEEPYKVNSPEGNYLINVCGGTRKEGSCQNASVCAVGDSEQENYGSADSLALTLNSMHLILTSEGPGACGPNKIEKKKSQIIFTCDDSAGIGSPTLLSQKDECFVTFLWTTSVTCPTSLPKCTVFDGIHFYDLRMFSSISHSWSVRDSHDNTYWLNICNEIQHEVINDKNHHCPLRSAVCRVKADGQGISIGNVASQRLRGSSAEGVDDVTLQYSNGDEMCTLSNGTQVPVSTVIRLVCNKEFMEKPKFVSGPSADCTYRFEWKTSEACPKMKEEELVDENGLIFDRKFPDRKMNLTEHIYTPFLADEAHRDKYNYLFNIANGIKNNSDCNQAAVCQTKENSFFRDIGSVPTRRFFFQGSAVKLVLSSNGRPCGKNANKNVTTTVMFHCEPEAGLGNPEFFYESNNCDYLFNWETSAVCSTTADKRKTQSTMRTVTKKAKGGSSFSTEAIVGLVLSLILVVVLIGVLAKEERRSNILYKMKNCFHKVKLPRYRYIQSDGDPILLSPDEPMHRFHEDTDI